MDITLNSHPADAGSALRMFAEHLGTDTIDLSSDKARLIEVAERMTALLRDAVAISGPDHRDLRIAARADALLDAAAKQL